MLPISEPDADAGSVFDAPALAAEPMTFEPVEVETPNLDPMAFETIEPAPPAPMETPGFEPMVFDTPVSSVAGVHHPAHRQLIPPWRGYAQRADRSVARAPKLPPAGE